MTIKREIKKLRDNLNLNLKPIGEQGANAPADYLGISESDLNKEVTTKEFLALYHNAIMHQAFIENPDMKDWKERCHPVPGIPQGWDGVKLTD